MDTAPDARPLAIVYVRVSTDAQADSGLSLEDQQAIAAAAAELAGYRVEVVREEGRSAWAPLRKRPLMIATLHRLNKGDAAALYAANLDRVCRNVRDMLDIADWANAGGWRLSILDVAGAGAVDTATAGGRFTLTILAAVAELESAKRSDRTRAFHRAAAARGKAWGVTQGPRPMTPAAVVARIVRDRADGATLTGIADALNADQVPTPSGRGARWYPSTVRTVLTSPAVTGKPRKPRKRKDARPLPALPATA